MKRSEMLTLIQEIINCERIDADNLLTTLETEGMLPPSRKMNYRDSQVLRRYASDEFFEYHKWDEEPKKEETKTWSDDEIPF